MRLPGLEPLVPGDPVSIYVTLSIGSTMCGMSSCSRKGIIMLEQIPINDSARIITWHRCELDYMALANLFAWFGYAFQYDSHVAEFIRRLN